MKSIQPAKIQLPVIDDTKTESDWKAEWQEVTERLLQLNHEMAEERMGERDLQFIRELEDPELTDERFLELLDEIKNRESTQSAISLNTAKGAKEYLEQKLSKIMTEYKFELEEAIRYESRHKPIVYAFAMGRLLSAIEMLRSDGDLTSYVRDICIKVERSFKATDHDKKILYESAIREADSLWAKGDSRLHNAMARFLCNKRDYTGRLSPGELMKMLKPTARRYDRLYGIKKGPLKQLTPT